MEEQKKVRKHTTSSKVRNRWNAKHYDRVNITIPKGYGEILKDFCYENGTTPNAVLCSIIRMEVTKAMQKDADELDAVMQD